MADSTAADRSPRIVPDSCERAARSLWHKIVTWAAGALLAAAAAAALAALLPRRRRGTRRLRRSRPWHRPRAARAREPEPPA